MRRFAQCSSPSFKTGSPYPGPALAFYGFRKLTGPSLVRKMNGSAIIATNTKLTSW